MKRVVFLLALLLCGGSAFADNRNEDVFRSTCVATTGLFNVFVASGAIIVKRIIINTAVASSTLKLFNGSASTGTAIAREVIDTSATGTYLDYSIIFSSGLMYGKDGTANVTLVWDWWKVPTPGRETVGR